MNFKKWLENLDPNSQDNCETIKLEPNQRVHTTLRTHIEIRSEPKQKSDFKPRGFWYACGDDWIRWCRGERFRTNELKNVFLLNLDFSNILLLDTVKKIEEFNREYKDGYFIDWRKVSEQYNGIEICPYQWDLRLKLNWYYTWDVASGCIWDKQAVKNITKIQ